MPPVEITTLGGLRLVSGGDPVEWLATQRLRAAFIVFLAVEREVSRDRLAGMFWPESDPDRSRRSLNQVIYSLRRSLGEGTIITDGERVRIGPDVSVDVQRFAAAADRGDSAAALHEYGGRFLADAALGGSAEFEQWIDAKRVVLERQHRRIARAAIDAHTSAGDPSAALRAAQQWCEQDPEEDEAHHRYLELLLQSGRRSEAVRHYERYREALRAAELEPLDATVELMANLRTRREAPEPVAAHTVQLRPEPRPDDAASPQPIARAGLIAELRRRGVIGTVTVYAVIAWACIQVATTVFPRLGLPEWTETLVIVLALLGLPFTVFFSWVYDVTPEGVRRASTIPATARIRPRLHPRWMAGALVLLVAGFGVWRIAAEAPAIPPSGAVAVFPFCAKGEGVEDASEHVSQLLAEHLDVLPELAASDPNVVLPAAANAKLNCRDARAAAGIAKQLGATQFLLGSIVSAGREVTGTAHLYDVEARGGKLPLRWSVTTSATGPWTLVVDSLFRAIVVKQGATLKDRMLEAAATRTSSQDALKAYLEGESAMRRVDWKAAVEHFRQAVAIDSSYAVAWHRLAFALWSRGSPFDQRLHALEHAKRFAGSLQPREQALLYAFEPLLRGQPAAVRLLRAYVATYPDDAQGWSLLAEALLQLGAWADGRPGEADSAYQRAARLGYAEARFFVAWLYWETGKLAAMDSIMALINEGQAGAGEWVLGLRAVRAFASGDPRRVASMLDTIAIQTEEIRLAAIPWAHWAHNDSLRDRMMEEALAGALSDAGRADALRRAIGIRVGQGKLRRARELISQLAELRPEEALFFRARLALNPALPQDRAELRRLVQELQAGSGRDPTEGSGERTHYAARRFYFLARLQLALGQPAAALASAARLEGMPSSMETPNENTLVAMSIRAQLAAAQGDLPTVRRLLAGRVIEAPFYTDRHEFTREDALPAELLAARGRYAEAALAYEGVSGDYGPLASLRRGELWELAGERKKALAEYDNLAASLRDCDPELHPVRERAAQRLAQLRRS